MHESWHKAGTDLVLSKRQRLHFPFASPEIVPYLCRSPLDFRVLVPPAFLTAVEAAAQKHLMNNHLHPTSPPLFSMAKLADSHPLQTPERQRRPFRHHPSSPNSSWPRSLSIPSLPVGPGTDIHPLSVAWHREEDTVNAP